MSHPRVSIGKVYVQCVEAVSSLQWPKFNFNLLPLCCMSSPYHK